MFVIAQQHELPKRRFTISSQLHEKILFESVMDLATLDVVSAPLLFPWVQKPHKGLFWDTLCAILASLRAGKQIVLFWPFLSVDRQTEKYFKC